MTDMQELWLAHHPGATVADYEVALSWANWLVRLKRLDAERAEFTRLTGLVLAPTAPLPKDWSPAKPHL
jgi:hypothetical protein